MFSWILFIIFFCLPLKNWDKKQEKIQMTGKEELSPEFTSIQNNKTKRLKISLDHPLICRLRAGRKLSRSKIIITMGAWYALAFMPKSFFFRCFFVQHLVESVECSVFFLFFDNFRNLLMEVEIDFWLHSGAHLDWASFQHFFISERLRMEKCF